MSNTPPDGKLIYRCLTGKDDKAFCERVSQALEEGWRLHGSPSLAFDSEQGVMKVAQAVVWPGYQTTND
ncbi:DUF1737 domain-containing protein [Alteraurantiacibacter aquimixticola]|uniref:DUF1737 domain-containing protein n=1 Tax=Alteraurantiacibacter aquimixticola TaxID=2489173 RepID=A0A4T3EZU0_9SPHN|nr:DUF1737 domain-containing protein [Alteraurantiacibacter aquimixticola]TIX49664.1 DUF1737 domain-containing protein [Alteraurantiacibacter aquimixticola]